MQKIVEYGTKSSWISTWTSKKTRSIKQERGMHLHRNDRYIKRGTWISNGFESVLKLKAVGSMLQTYRKAV